MAESAVLLDTSILIDFFRSNDKRATHLYRLSESFSLYAPSVVEFEVLAGATDEQKRRDVLAVLRLCDSLPIDSLVAQRAAELFIDLRRQNKRVEIRDLFIGATASVHGLLVATLNTDHFRRMGLPLHPLG